MEIMGPHAPYEARRVVLMAGYGTLGPLGAHVANADTNIADIVCR